MQTLQTHTKNESIAWSIEDCSHEELCSVKRKKKSFEKA